MNAKDLFTTEYPGKKLAYSVVEGDAVTIDANGVITAAKAGKATIKAKSKYAKKAATVEVTVKNYVLQNVAQNKTNELVATVTGDTSKIKPTDIKVVNKATNVVYPVQKVSVDDNDKTKVTLAIFSELNDGKEYEVTLDGVTKSFVASDGKVASIALDTVTIPYATATEIKLIAKDAQGVIVKELNYEAAAKDSNYDFTINTNGNGYVAGSKLYLNKVGDTAVAEITYKTGKYDQNGKPEGNIGPDKVTITATAQSEVNNFDVRIDSKTTTKFDKAKDNKKISVGTKDNAAFFMIKNAAGNEVDYSKYTVTSSDNSVLMLASDKIGVKNSVGVTPVKEGVAYIMIKKDDVVVNAVMITVVAERAVATMELDTYDITLSRKLQDSKDVTAKFKDQYGDEISGNVVAECLSTDVKDAKADTYTSYATTDKNKTTFVANNFDKGNYVFKISYKKDGKEVVAKTVSVHVTDTDATTATSWKIDVSKPNVDINVNNDNNDSQQLSVKVIGMAEGVDLIAEQADFTVTDKDGKVVYGGTGAVTGAAFNAGVTTKTDNLVVTVVNVANGKADVLLGAGTYNIKATIKDSKGNDVVLSGGSFTVTDKQAKAGVEFTDVKNTFKTNQTLAEALQAALKVTYGETTYTGATKGTDTEALTIVSAKALDNQGNELKIDDSLATVNTFVLSELKVTVTVAESITMDVTIDLSGINTTFSK